MLPPTATRVQENTADRVNEEIRRRTEENIARYAAEGPEAIDRRLRELDEEWDVERTLQTNFAIVSLVGLGLGAFVHRGWYYFTAVAAGFMVQHSLQGWCPPIPIFRRLGVRTMAEIEHERYALKALRGDFDGVAAEGRDGARHAGRVLEAAAR